MKKYTINVKNPQKNIYPAKTKLGGINLSGDRISFTNYYMEKNNQPFQGICGEFHFSRYHHTRWEDELIKMKMGGVNIIATYIFWNHHEEDQGVFLWTENRNVRKFVEICAKHELYVILRIGPFAHGEVRNGGLPDWLFGRPFDLRSNDIEYLEFVKNFYQEIGKQVKGLLFKDNGPIIGTQLENEYEHAGAPWEITAGTSNEWLPAGRDGDSHILTLKKLAIEANIETPLYTCTGWGGAAAPSDEVLPLWGGYAFWPWIFYGDVKEHPATPEFIYRDFHHNEKENYGFTPTYRAEDLPYACCEMGAGMTNFYQYRFTLPYESVDAMANVKLAGGCNFIGYYVFHGGSNPIGKYFLNENATPKISYDYQAPIGEFGQIRESYKRLKRLHYFLTTFEKEFSKSQTILPDMSDHIDPTDIESLRYAVRAHKDAGFLFINNYQDHVEMKDKHDISISIQLNYETINLPNSEALSIAKNTSCVLPFNFKMDGTTLKYSTTQLITKMKHNGESYYFFFTPKGMKAEYCFSREAIQNIERNDGDVIWGEEVVIKLDSVVDTHVSDITLNSGTNIHIVTLSDNQSLNFWRYTLDNQHQIVITDSTVLLNDNKLKLEYSNEQEKIELMLFPPLKKKLLYQGREITKQENDGFFDEYYISTNTNKLEIDSKKVGHSKAKIDFSPDFFNSVKEPLLNIDYIGDIGYAFIDGKLIHDNFSNNDVWQIGLKQYQQELIEKGMYLYVSPLKEGSYVKSDSPMAARTEINDNTSEIKSIKATAICEIQLEIE
ncbi:beta-galactosidase [Metabacillus litoralis]|uniref:beta-galactosidase n=1 Tax=Metabacillus litoralis TaxID=152268 RepID=UPI001CFEBD5A|nr:beta-galactosidase [Metabacillus litoralis]